MPGNPTDIGPCRHCCVRKANRCRGLCNHCYCLPGVRDLYPISEVSSTYCGLAANQYKEPPLPIHPTHALPGTNEKIRVLQLRVLAKVGLWHPDDVVDPDGLANYGPSGSGWLAWSGDHFRYRGGPPPLNKKSKRPQRDTHVYNARILRSKQ